MSLLFKCINVKKIYGDRVILKDVSFHVEVGDRIGIVGNNGAGKTTLANIITRSLKPDSGQILWHSKDIKIGYLHQSTYYSENDYKNIINNDKEEIKDYLHTSKKLGINKVNKWGNERLNNLSGGEKTKLALAKIWSEKPQLLILDEPTNHMDIQGIKWLIGEIEKYQGTVMIISHDRYFIDKSVTRIVEIDEGVAHSYNGNYTFYRNDKKSRYSSQLHQYEEQEKYKRKIESDIKQLKQWSDKGHRESTKKEGMKEFYRVRAKKKDKQIKSRIKRLEKIEVEGIEKPKDEQSIKFNFISNRKCSERILEAKDIIKRFDDNILFNRSSFFVKKSEKVAVFGPNGCGKTTLIKGLLNELEMDDGELYFSQSAKVAYLSQDVMNLDENKTVLELFGIDDNEKRGLLQTLLANMGFTNDMVHKTISTLSLGERTRLKVAQMIMMQNNVLIFDEPTNHLDLHSREMLEQTLSHYQGTILVVSHDRYFLEKLCNKVLVFENQKIIRYEYSFKSYLEISERKKRNETQKSKEEQLMIINNRISAIMGEFNGLTIDSEKYIELDKEFKSLIELKKELTSE